MPGLDTGVVVQKLTINLNFLLVKQVQKKIKFNLEEKIIEEIKKQIEMDFIRGEKYPNWIIIIVPIRKKIGILEYA